MGYIVIYLYFVILIYNDLLSIIGILSIDIYLFLEYINGKNILMMKFIDFR